MAQITVTQKPTMRQPTAPLMVHDDRAVPSSPIPAFEEIVPAILRPRGLTAAADAGFIRRSYPSLGSSVVDHSATSARSRKVTVICPLAPSILT